MSMSSGSGGTLNTATACFSQDGAHVFLASGATVRVYSASTGDRLLVLSGHTAEVTAIHRHPRSDALILSASLDGTIKLWDYAEAAVKQTWTVGHPITAMVLPNKQSALLSTHWRNGQAGRIIPYNFAQKKLHLEHAVKLRAPSARLALAADGRLAAAIDRNSLLLIHVAHQSSKPITLHHTRNLTCVAFDASGGHIAAGDVSGRIIIWSGLKAVVDGQGKALSAEAAAQQLTTTTIHWHAHAVGALVFSHDGVYLLSAGHEAVLVIWQLETMKKAFLPRLGGHITHIALNPYDAARCAVCQASNAVRLVAISTMQVECSIYGVRPGPEGVSAVEANDAAVLQPGSGYLALSCSSSQLQFYDVAKDRHVARLNVVPRNVVSATESSGQEAREPCVSRLAFTADSATLVTVETSPSASSKLSYVLKFWDSALVRRNPCMYVVNTSSHDPHLGAITALACHPSEQEAVTCGVRRAGGGGEFRIWVQSRVAPKPGSDAPSWHWICRSVGSYQDRPMTAAAYAPDGTVLAVACKGVVTLWQPDDNVLMATLNPPATAAAAPTTRLAFLQGSAHLVSAHGGSQPCLCVWDLLTLSLHWCCEGTVTDLSPHPVLPHFAAVFPLDDGHSAVATIAADEPDARQTWVSHVPICRAMFAPLGSALHSRSAAAAGHAQSAASVPLLLVSDMRRFTLLQESEAPAGERGDAQQLEVAAQLSSRQGYNAMYGSMPKPAGVSAGQAPESIKAVSDLSTLFDAPSHLLPPTTELCDMLLRTLLTPS